MQKTATHLVEEVCGGSVRLDQFGISNNTMLLKTSLRTIA